MQGSRRLNINPTMQGSRRLNISEYMSDLEGHVEPCEKIPTPFRM